MTLLLVRHAEAESRTGWPAPDLLRPLSARGRRQALGMVRTLGDEYSVGRIWSSPYLRCIETLAPLASALGLSVDVTEVLAEAVDPAGAMAMARQGTSSPGGALMLCSHGDLIPAILETLRSVDGLDLGPQPRCQKGSTWVIDGPHAHFTSATYIPPG